MELAAVIDRAVQTLPADLARPVRRWFERVAAQDVVPSPAAVADLVRVVAVSEFAAGVLLRDWDKFGPALESFAAPPDRDALTAFARNLRDSDVDGAKSLLRHERNQQLVHILWRDLCGYADVEETLADLSHLADCMLIAAGRVAARSMRERFGVVRDADGNSVPLIILGMGKLGGGELNFSSDIDIIFTFPRDGSSDGGRSLHAQQYFDRLSRHVIALIGDVTADGFVYRTDTRLRPFGDSGPPVVSFAALESYLAKHGRDWERYAYVKARIVGPRPAADARDELFDELILPFVYRRYLDYGVFESLRDMHSKISVEVERRELADNVKLGPGGIREIEFIVQSLQLVRGGSRPELQNASLLEVLPLLADGKEIDAATRDGLKEAYLVLRRVENAIQAIRDEQTHELPTDESDRSRLCLAMGAGDWATLKRTLDEHRAFVSRTFSSIAFRRNDTADDDEPFSSVVNALWDAHAGANEWQAAFEAQGFVDAGPMAERIATFREASATRKMDNVARDRVRTFIPRLVKLAQRGKNPSRAFGRCLTVLESILRRSAYIALLNENRLAAERLVGLCEQSTMIARELARFPVLLDELLDPRPVSGPVTRLELTAELEERLAAADSDSSEARTETLIQFQRANLFRVAVADFSGELPIMKVSDSLTFLAEAVLEFALTLAWQDLGRRHGAPHYELEGEFLPAGFGIIAYGKLGGLELSYGSDLDVVFLHDSRGERQRTDGDKPLDNAMFFSRLVRRLVHILTTRTSTGELYEIDTRLRPSGRKGLLVTSVEAFERYQEENAWTWEHQALLRARPVAGSGQIAAEFDRIRTETLTKRVRRDSLRDDVLSMRAKMRTELDTSDADNFDLKQGSGGIGDIEFLVQYLVLQHAGGHPGVIEYTDNIRQLDALSECGIISTRTAAMLQDIYRAYRLRQHHLVLNEQPAVVPADTFRSERESVERCWQQTFRS